MPETPQFGTAEYQEQTGNDRCKTCGSSIVGQYFRVSGVVTCASCTERTAGQLRQDTHQAFVRAVVFGVGGALLGLILYSVVGIVTGLAIGYVSLAVGYIVGRAMMMGSSGVGGRRYQIAAVILTYAAVSMSAVPIAISDLSKQQSGKSEKPAELSATTTAESTPSTSAGKMNVVALLGFLAFIGLASPFLNLAEPLQGLIGLVILFVGLRIAWRTTLGTKVPIMGPFKV